MFMKPVRLQREGEGAYVVTFSLSSLTRLTSYKSLFILLFVTLTLQDSTMLGLGLYTQALTYECVHT